MKKLMELVEQVRREALTVAICLNELVKLRRGKDQMDRKVYEERRERLWALAYRISDDKALHHVLLPRRAPKAFVDALNEAHLAGASAAEYSSIEALWQRIID